MKNEAPPEKPCPYHAIAHNRRSFVYCEVGPDGHEGTHIGSRDEAEYQRLRYNWLRHQAWEKSQIAENVN